MKPRDRPAPTRPSRQSRSILPARAAAVIREWQQTWSALVTSGATAFGKRPSIAAMPKRARQRLSQKSAFRACCRLLNVSYSGKFSLERAAIHCSPVSRPRAFWCALSGETTNGTGRRQVLAKDQYLDVDHVRTVGVLRLRHSPLRGSAEQHTVSGLPTRLLYGRAGIADCFRRDALRLRFRAGQDRSRRRRC